LQWQLSTIRTAILRRRDTLAGSGASIGEFHFRRTDVGTTRPSSSGRLVLGTASMAGKSKD
jgi:hypothetical protein